MTSRYGVQSLLRLCEKGCSINMLNFKKFCFVVYEIFDNSQLFLIDPRTLIYTNTAERHNISFRKN